MPAPEATKIASISGSVFRYPCVPGVAPFRDGNDGLTVGRAVEGVTVGGREHQVGHAAVGGRVGISVFRKP